ncbi:MAG: serine/threonine protein kinase [Betaproteobacteria bacterium]|nr:serine/threonine protein kinase [Betaproteobacteria bacterium]
MRLLLLGATEGLRYRLSEMLGGSVPDSVLVARNYSAIHSLTEDSPSDIALCCVGRHGEHLASIRRFSKLAESTAGCGPIIALTDDYESNLAGRALIAGAHCVLPLPGLSSAQFAQALRSAHAENLRTTAMARPKEIYPRVPGYRLIRLIGEGGMSKVYLAEREDEDTPQVMKIVDAQLAQDETFLMRFARECKVLARIRHENVVRIHDFSADRNNPYLAMEYFAGGDLKSRIREGLPAMTALKIMMQLMKAIDAVHTAGLVHRDLKPHNIMFRDKDRLALVDFGLVKPIDPNTTAQMQLTQDGMILATPIYMSPEQCKGMQQDTRGDLYSCGIILFEMLAGKPPFMADNPAALAFLHVSAPVPRLPPKVAGFQNVVDKLLAKSPNDRFQSAKELFAHIAI